jgi:hypothetical protein
MRRLEVPSLLVWLAAPLPPWPPAPWTRAKGLQAVPPPQVAPGGSEEERRRRLRRANGSLVSEPPRSDRGLLVGPRRPAPRPTAPRGVSVLRPRCHHHHLGVINPGTPPAATAAVRAAIPSLPGSLEGLGPQVSVVPFSLSLIITSTGLNPSSVFQGFLPLCF